MRICIAHGGDVSQPSGGTDRVTALASGLQARGYDITLVVPEPGGSLPERLRSVDVHGVEAGFLGGGPAIARASAITKAAQSIAEERGAVLQLEHSSLAGVGTLRGCDGFVLDMHDVAYPRFDHVDSVASPILKQGVAWLERRAVERARHIIVVSDYMKQILQEDWGVPAENITPVPNGYFPERIESATSSDEVAGRVCFLGTLHPKVDVEAFEHIAELPSVSDVVVIGDGARRDDVDRLAAENSVIRAPGRLPDDEAFKLVASSEVVVNPQTDSELQRSSSPVKLFYYAALGKPMVVSAGPSVVRELESATAARSVSTRADLVAQVEELIEMPEHRRELSRNAATMAEEFSWSARVDQVASVYGKLTDGISR